ncbi:hypothetical protein HDU76_001787 [Blyttiomyces sp. JEL0837]|nr:hypothetical protein HDU76_001787 [Blyttiomyces sp. JEL0837]
MNGTASTPPISSTTSTPGGGVGIVPGTPARRSSTATWFFSQEALTKLTSTVIQGVSDVTTSVLALATPPPQSPGQGGLTASSSTSTTSSSTPSTSMASSLSMRSSTPAPMSSNSYPARGLLSTSPNSSSTHSYKPFSMLSSSPSTNNNSQSTPQPPPINPSSSSTPPTPTPTPSTTQSTTVTATTTALPTPTLTRTTTPISLNVSSPPVPGGSISGRTKSKSFSLAHTGTAVWDGLRMAGNVLMASTAGMGYGYGYGYGFSGGAGSNGDLSGIGVSRVHAKVVVGLPSSYSDWERSVVEYGDENDYSRGALLGRGKYSHVFECTRKQDGLPCVVKVFKPQKSRKFKREVLVLKNLQGGPNIVGIVGCYLDRENNEPAIVFERKGNVNWKEFYPKMSYGDLRLYMRELMKAVAYCHSKGIMHRDLKPHNICIDPVKRELTLIDWGLADFYRPNQEFNLRVASRFYKPPEILLGYRRYDYSFDMWSIGCILAGMIFRKEVFFRGEDDTDQLRKITEVLGGSDLRAYISKYNIDIESQPQFEDVAKVVKEAGLSRQPWYEYVGWNNGDLARENALDLLDGLLRYDHQSRFTADECLEHAFFGE